MTFVTSAPKCECIIGLMRMACNNSCRTFIKLKGEHFFVLETKVHTSLKTDIVGLLNCIKKTHLPAITWTHFFTKNFWLKSHNVERITLRKRSVDPPTIPSSPFISAPSSSTRALSLTIFFLEETTPALFQICSANWWHSFPWSAGSGGTNLSAAAKLSKYTCHHTRCCPLAWLSVSVINLGSPFVRRTCPKPFSPPVSNRFSETSCIIDTLEIQPIGMTLQASTKSTSACIWETPIS